MLTLPRVNGGRANQRKPARSTACSHGRGLPPLSSTKNNGDPTHLEAPMTEEYKKTDLTNAAGDMTVLTVSARRLQLERCGVLVRARVGDEWVTADVIQLDRRSLLAWLRSRGTSSPWAEDFIGYLLGHGPLNGTDDQAIEPVNEAPGNKHGRPS